MSNNIKCPHCNTPNQIGAQHCKGCGRSMNTGPASPKPGGGKLFYWMTKKTNSVLDLTDDFLDAFSSGGGQNVSKSQAQRRNPPSNLNRTREVRAPKLIKPKNPGESIGPYQIQGVKKLGRSNYYQVYEVLCKGCQTENLNSTDHFCKNCKQPLMKRVLRESFANRVMDQGERDNIIAMSLKIQGVLNHHDFTQGDRQYILLDGFPEPWFSLAEDKYLPIREPEKVTAWMTQIGNAINQLHQLGYSFYDENQLSDRVEPLLVLKNQQVYLADITSSRLDESGTPSTRQKDIFYMAKVLYAIVTGSRENVSRKSGRLNDVPSPFRELINRAQSGGFSTIDAFLTAVHEKPKQNEVARSLRQLVGYGTDIGKFRDHNEDYVSKFALGLEQVPGTPEVGLYIVADGMGGHQAGEKASESVIKDVVINRIQEQMQKLQAVPKLKRATIKLDDVLTPGDILREAIEQANQVLLNARDAASGSDRGTTITAALVIGATCSIANVGDSRTYLLRQGNLVQITQDHSLVASLVASNQIKPSEVRSHPQRNQIYRTLGDQPGVEVDVFAETLVPGDQLMLCSDGLWEMVLDDTIVEILLSSRTPQAACDRLIEAANAGGGEDNISVIVIWLE